MALRGNCLSMLAYASLEYDHRSSRKLTDLLRCTQDCLHKRSENSKAPFFLQVREGAREVMPADHI